MAEVKKSTGTVKWFSAQKGFGFIAPDGSGEDLFVHQTSIRSDGFRTLFDGQAVEFSVDYGEDQRAKAVDVTVISRSSGFGGGRGGGRGRGSGSGRSAGEVMAATDVVLAEESSTTVQAVASVTIVVGWVIWRGIVIGETAVHLPTMEGVVDTAAVGAMAAAAVVIIVEK